MCPDKLQRWPTRRRKRFCRAANSCESHTESGTKPLAQLIANADQSADRPRRRAFWQETADRNCRCHILGSSRYIRRRIDPHSSSADSHKPTARHADMDKLTQPHAGSSA